MIFKVEIDKSDHSCHFRSKMTFSGQNDFRNSLMTFQTKDEIWDQKWHWIHRFFDTFFKFRKLTRALLLVTCDWSIAAFLDFFDGRPVGLAPFEGMIGAEGSSPVKSTSVNGKFICSHSDKNIITIISPHAVGVTYFYAFWEKLKVIRKHYAADQEKWIPWKLILRPFERVYSDSVGVKIVFSSKYNIIGPFELLNRHFTQKCDIMFKFWHFYVTFDIFGQIGLFDFKLLTFNI